MLTLRFTKQSIADCTQPGPADEAVDGWAYTMRKQLDRQDTEEIRRYLLSSGCWEEEELADDYRNRRRLLWIAAGNCEEEKTCLFQDCA